MLYSTKKEKRQWLKYTKPVKYVEVVRSSVFRRPPDLKRECRKKRFLLGCISINRCVFEERSFLITTARRYNVKGKSYFNYPNKYYYTDISLRNARLNYRQYDPGHIMENLIYNELLRHGYSVDVGVVYDRKGGANIPKEIGFIVNDGDKKTLYSICISNGYYR